MLANILKNEAAIHMNIRIIEIFVCIREMILTHKDILLQLKKFEKQVEKNSEDISMIFSALRQLLDLPEKPRKKSVIR